LRQDAPNKIRNPNIEIRNKLEELNANYEIQKRLIWAIEFLMIEIVSNFGFRVSHFVILVLSQIP